MSISPFTDAEIALFAQRFPPVAAWGRWIRHQPAAGGEVIEMSVEGRRPAKLRLVKTDDGRFAACGFDGWSLTVCDDLDTLLDVVARMLPAEARDRTLAEAKRSAA